MSDALARHGLLGLAGLRDSDQERQPQLVFVPQTQRHLHHEGDEKRLLSVSLAWTLSGSPMSPFLACT